MSGATIAVDRFDAVIFDMDGVVTDTASTHAAAWSTMFDAFLGQRPPAEEDHRPVSAEDYLRYIDGKPRYSGVSDFLRSRGITLPWGSPADPPSSDTVCGLGNRKNEIVLKLFATQGVKVFPSTVALVDQLRARGIRIAVISASQNCADVLRAAGVAGLFDARVDGTVVDELGLPGKPDPAMFHEAARRLGVDPARTVVVEDARAGVQAGRRGGFGLVIGVDRSGHPEELAESGAHVVVRDLAEVEVG
ncbi:MAG TPA: beta-phosphoglucomutase family hydrolase [Jiangellaceae bacterium]